MADKKGPKVGDPAQIDGRELQVMEVTKKHVRFADADRIAAPEAVREIRAKYADDAEALQAKFDKVTEEAIAEAEEAGVTNPTNLVKAARAVVKAEIDLHNAKLRAELDSVPGGISVGSAPQYVHWVDEHECWSVPGRFHAHPGEGQKRPADPASLQNARS